MSTPFVIGMVWKSAVVAAVVLALLVMMRRHSAMHRAAVGAAGLAVLALLPGLAASVLLFPLPSIDVQAPSVAAPMIPMMIDPVQLPVAASAEAAVPVTEPLPWAAIITALWAFGAMCVIGRLLVGLATLQRWTAAGEELSFPYWTSMMRRCGAPEAARLIVSDRVSAPLSWGWLWPVILIHRDLIHRPDQAEAVIAHEAAHLNRLDWPRLLAARLVVALFWFNPLVWLLERKHQQDVEEAADAEATSRVDPAQYAQTLLNVASGTTAPAGANSMASGTLSTRIARVLDRRTPSRWERTWRSGALAGTAVMAGAVALTQFVTPTIAAAVSAPPALKELVSVAPKAPVATMVAVDVAPPPVATVKPVAKVAPPAPVPTVQAVNLLPAYAVTVQKVDEEAIASAERAAARAEAAARDAQKAGERAHAVGMAAMRKGLLAGADGMVAGAENMRRGAAQMREEARKLRDPAYRAQKISEAKAHRAYGYSYSTNGSSFTFSDRVPTDKDLVGMIPQLEKGAAEMEKGAKDMLKGAEDMRRSARQS